MYTLYLRAVCTKCSYARTIIRKNAHLLSVFIKLFSIIFNNFGVSQFFFTDFTPYFIFYIYQFSFFTSHFIFYSGLQLLVTRRLKWVTAPAPSLLPFPSLHLSPSPLLLPLLLAITLILTCSVTLSHTHTLGMISTLPNKITPLNSITSTDFYPSSIYSYTMKSVLRE